MRVNGKTKLVEEIVAGRYNEESKAWEFNCDEPTTKAWLENTFNNPPERPGSSQLYVNNDEGFLFYIMSFILPCKGWEMEWGVGDFVSANVGEKYDPYDISDFHVGEQMLGRGTPDVKKASVPPSRHQELVDLHRAHILETDLDRVKEIGAQLRARLNEIWLTEEEQDKLNEDVIDMWAEEYSEAMKQKEGDDKNHVRERVNKLLARLDEDGAALFAQRLREKMSGSIAEDFMTTKEKLISEINNLSEELLEEILKFVKSLKI